MKLLQIVIVALLAGTATWAAIQAELERREYRPDGSYVIGMWAGALFLYLLAALVAAL